MAGVAKRVATSSVNWAKLGEKLIPEHSAELIKIKSICGTFQSAVSQLPADLPKVDFAALKKEMPAHAAILDSLQKQYEALKIPYGEVPAEYTKEVEKWSEYNNARIQFHEQKVADGLEEAKKIEEKWAKAPPVEHFNRQHFAEYFPQEFYDLRYQNRLPDPCGLGLNENFHLIEERFKDYKVLRRPDKVDDH
ncbi:hypothetical protein WR25_05344 [Diploscapter pachys]|uniref:Uncharacterized protein n=1 Tax=Diploscapter pachys TaxID=2018661 RepID=A0A2A2K9V0_9BILA|nr:hypothetical protein WR25_05344 [Diploscapter pachys]